MAKTPAKTKKTAAWLLIAVVFFLQWSAKAGNLEYFGTPRGLNLAGFSGFKDVLGHWAEASIARVSAMDLMKGDGVRFFPQRAVTREEALAVLVRLAGLDSSRISGKSGNPASNLRASTWAVPYLELAFQMGMLERSENTLDFRMPAKRQEVLAWVARAMKLMPLPAGEVLYFEDLGDIDKQKLPYIAALVKKGIAGGWGGRLYPLNSMTRAELAALVDRIKEEEVFKLEVFRGTVISAENRGNSQVVYSIKTEDGPVYEIYATRGLNDFPVLRGRKRYGSWILKAGDYVEVVAKGSEVLYAEVSTPSAVKISGQLSGIDKDQLCIKDESGNTVYLKLPDFPEVFIDGRKASLSDLLPGLGLTVFAVNGRASRIEVTTDSEASMPEGGWQEAADFPVEGTIKDIYEDGGIYTITVAAGEEKKISITGLDLILKDGMKVNPALLEIGDKVTVYMGDDKNLRVEVAKGGGISRLVKGKIAGHLGGEYLLVSDVKEFYYGVFKNAEGMLKVKLRGTEAYFEGRSVDIEKLIKEYRGKDAYFALTDDGGIYRAVKVVVKSGDEYLENGFIDRVRWSTGEIVLGDLEMLMDESTIAVLGSLPVSYEYLNKNGGTFVVANESLSGPKAALIYQPKFLGPNLKVIKGQVYEIERDGFVVSYRSELEESLWSSEEKSRESLKIYDDAVIMDAAGSSPKTLSKEEFLQDRYEKKFYGKNFYALLESGKIRAMVIKEGGRSDDVVSLGVFNGFSQGGFVKLKDMLDFSQFNERWNSNLGTLELKISGAIVLEGGRPLNFEDLKTGQVLYVIRENNNCLLAFVQK